MMLQYTWPKAISITCNTDVLLESKIIGYLTNFLILPPLFPEKQKVLIPLFFAIFIASIRFSLFPEVVIAIATSPVFPIASSCLEKIYLNPKSLPIDVKAEVSVVKASAGRAFLIFLYLEVSSVAKC